MRDILDTADQRLILILELLVFRDDWITIKEISEKIGASTRTITYDLKRIREEWDDYLEVSSSATKGVYLENKSISVLSKVIKQILRGSTSLKLLDVLFYLPFKSKDYYCKLLGISHSLFSQYLKEYRSVLSELEIEIKTDKNHCYYLDSKNERRLRIFITCFQIELSEIAGKPLMYNVEKFRTMMQEIEQFVVFEEDIQDSSIIYYYTLLEVSLIRECSGFNINADSEFDIPISDKAFKIGIELYPLISKDVLKNVYFFMQEDLYYWESEEEEKEVKDIIADELDVFFKQINTKPTKELRDGLIYLISDLYVVSQSIDFNSSSLFNRDHYFANNYKVSNREVYEKYCEMFLRIVERTNKNLIYQLNGSISWACVYFPEFLLLKIKKKVLVISELGYKHGNMLKQQLERLFNNPYDNLEIDVVTEQDFKHNCSEYDLIVSSVLKKCSANKVVIIQDIITYRDIGKIGKVLYEK